MENIQFINLAINVLLALVAFFGGTTIRGLSESIKDLRQEDKALRDRLDGFVKIDAMESWRRENHELSTRIFEKLEQIQRELGSTVTRTECAQIRKDMP